MALSKTALALIGVGVTAGALAIALVVVTVLYVGKLKKTSSSSSSSTSSSDSSSSSSSSSIDTSLDGLDLAAPQYLELNTASNGYMFEDAAPFRVEIVCKPLTVGVMCGYIDHLVAGQWFMGIADDGKFVVHREEGTPDYDVKSDDVIELGIPHIFTMSYDGETMNQYIDGVLTGTGSSTGNMPSNAAKLRIGASAVVGVGWNFCEGTYNSFKIWDTALASTESLIADYDFTVEDDPGIYNNNVDGSTDFFEVTSDV